MTCAPAERRRSALSSAERGRQNEYQVAVYGSSIGLRDEKALIGRLTAVVRNVSRVYSGDREPRYAEIAMMSSSERFATARFINAAALPALDP